MSKTTNQEDVRITQNTTELVEKAELLDKILRTTSPHNWSNNQTAIFYFEGIQITARFDNTNPQSVTIQDWRIL